VGYAFINFIDCLSIVPFYDEFHGKKWEKFNSEKVCAITYARIQGKVPTAHVHGTSNRPTPPTHHPHTTSFVVV
jgi:hypothetical protein